MEFDEEAMKPPLFTEKPRNAGVDIDTVKMKRWYQLESRVSDQRKPA